MKRHIFYLAFGLLALFSSCSSDDDSSNHGDHDNLVNKWWYSADGSTLDIYFNSNGTYESVYGTLMESDGKWEWTNEDDGILRIYDLENNATTQYHAKVLDLTAHTLRVSVSFDGGETYSGSYDYLDVDEE